jgi:thiol:disulfide interchange protein DsbD
MVKIFFRTFILLGALLFNPIALHASNVIEPVQAKIVAEEATVQPGRPFWVGIKLNMAEGWDTYWHNPGDSGFPTEIKWNLPEGFKAGPILWPYPEKIVNETLVAFGYTDTVLLLTEITPPAHLSPNQKVAIKADVNWLACKEECVPGSASLELNLPVANKSPVVDPALSPLFANARRALPKKEGNLSVVTQADQLMVSFNPQSDSGEIEGMLFIPEEGEIIDNIAPQTFHVEGGIATLNIKKAHPEADLSSLKGVLLLSEKGSTIKRAIQVDSAISAPPPVSKDGVSSLAVALGFAFVGGLILNVMPCVLPVIALKIFSFVKMAEERRGVILQHGGFFSLGVLISFWLLSGALLVLRAYGEGVGWGFQLQEPIFVAILASLLFLLGLSLFGVFELGTSLISVGNKASSIASSSPLKSSFMSGVLATLVATPCTGPLLGPALGFAMTLPTLKALMIFTTMGLGMAFPYLLFSAFPHLVRFLPKPGNWMVAFKQIMGFLMMATVVWLIWVFGAQTDNLATFILLAGFLIMAIGAWVFGKWASFTSRRFTRIMASLVASVLFLTGGGAAVMVAKQHRDIAPITQIEAKFASDMSSDWAPYSPQKVEELRALGTPVFVDFTAKWCLICQANKVTLHSSEVEKAFHEKGVVTMVADWTKRDAVITKQLEKLGRTGVPVYVLYSGNPKEEPYILPQTLTANVINDYLGKLKPPTESVQADTLYAH